MAGRWFEKRGRAGDRGAKATRPPPLVKPFFTDFFASLHLDGDFAFGFHGDAFEILERFHRLFRPVLLNKSNDGIEYDDHYDGDGIGKFADDAGYGCGSHEHKDHKVPELIEEHHEEGLFFFFL